jgi:hypothetical protein
MTKWVFPDEGYNPGAQAAILEVVENQVANNDPPETRATFQRLVGLGYSEMDAKKLIGCCVACEIYSVMRPGGGFDRERFVAALEQLPDVLPFAGYES